LEAEAARRQAQAAAVEVVAPRQGWYQRARHPAAGALCATATGCTTGRVLPAAFAGFAASANAAIESAPIKNVDCSTTVRRCDPWTMGSSTQIVRTCE
jgi:hypothetical protein